MRPKYKTDIGLIDAWHTRFFATPAVDLDLNHVHNMDYFNVYPGSGDFGPAFLTTNSVIPFSGEILDYIYDADIMEQFMAWQEKEFKYHEWYPQYTGAPHSRFQKWYKHSINSSGLFANSGVPYDISNDVEFTPSESGNQLWGHVAKSMSFINQSDDRTKFTMDNYYPAKLSLGAFNFLTGDEDYTYYFDFSQNNWEHFACWDEKVRWSNMVSTTVNINHYSATENDSVYWFDGHIFGWSYYPPDPYRFPNYELPLWVKKPADSMNYVGSEWWPGSQPDHFNQGQGFPTSSGWYLSDNTWSIAGIVDSGVFTLGELISPSGSLYPVNGGTTNKVNGPDIINTQQLVVNNQIVFKSNEVAAGFAIWNTNYAYTIEDALGHLGVNIGGVPGQETIADGSDQVFRKMSYITDAIGIASHQYRLFCPRETSLNSNPNSIRRDISTTSMQNRLGWVKEFEGVLEDLKATIPAERRLYANPSGVYFAGYGNARGPINILEGDHLPRPGMIPGASELSDYQVVMGSGFVRIGNFRNSMQHKFFRDLMDGSFTVLGDLDGDIDFQKVMDHKGDFYVSIVPKSYRNSVPEAPLPAIIKDEVFTCPTPRYRLKTVTKIDPASYPIAVILTEFGIGTNYGTLVPAGNTHIIKPSIKITEEVNSGSYTIFDIRNQPYAEWEMKLDGKLFNSQTGAVTDLTFTRRESLALGSLMGFSLTPVVQNGIYYETDRQPFRFGNDTIFYNVGTRIKNYTNNIPGTIVVQLRTVDVIIATVNGNTYGISPSLTFEYVFELINQQEILDAFDRINSDILYYGAARPDYIPVSYTLDPEMAGGGMIVSNSVANLNEVDTAFALGQPSKRVFIGQALVGDAQRVVAQTSLGTGGNEITDWRGTHMGYVLEDNRRHVCGVIDVPVTNDTSTVDIVKRVYPSGKIRKSSL